jgi:amidase
MRADLSGPRRCSSLSTPQSSSHHQFAQQQGLFLDPVTGLDLLLDTIRFITPGNVLGLPSVALPMGVTDGLPTGIQIYADLWREDLCLDVAEVIEAAVSPAKVIDP